MLDEREVHTPIREIPLSPRNSTNIFEDTSDKVGEIGSIIRTRGNGDPHGG